MSNNDEFETFNPAEQEEEYFSKTDIKKQMYALQELGAKLTKLNGDQLSKVPMSDKLLSAVEESHRIKSNGAMKRHLQYIGKIMRTEDCEAIEHALGLFEAGHQAHTQAFHKLERWRDRLISEGNSALQAYVEEYPNADIQHLRQLIRNAAKEQQQGKPPAAARKLFKYLRELAEI